MFAESIALGNIFQPSNNVVTLAHTCDGAGTATIVSAFGFVGTGKILDKIRVYCTAASNLSQVDCEIRPEKSTGGCNTNGTSLATVSKTTGLPTAAGWVEFSGFNLQTTAGVQYYAVFANRSTGTTPSITLQYASGIQQQPWGGLATASNFCKGHGTGGVTFTTAVASGVTGLSFIYSDGSRQGLPTQMISSSSSTRIHNGVETGARFTISKDCSVNLAAVSACSSAIAGAPTGNVFLRIYEGTSLIYTSGNFITMPIAINRHLFCPAKVTLKAGRTYRAVFCADGGDASNYIRLMFHQLDAAATPYQCPMLEGFQLTQGSGATWTDTPTIFPAVTLILHPTTPFYPAPLNRRRITNQR